MNCRFCNNKLSHEFVDLGFSPPSNSFLRAGAKNIISTLWPVDDKITKEFMLLFYQELLKSNNINTSLRNTKQIIKNKYKYPNYWAPFILLQNKI